MQSRFRSHNFQKRPVECSAEEAVKQIRSGDTVFMHTAAASPCSLTRAMIQESDRLADVQLFNLHLDYSDPELQKQNFSAPQYASSFYSNNFFVKNSTRPSVLSGQSGYVPMNLSQVPHFLESHIRLNVALLNVSPPDRKGFCTLGVSVDVSLAAALNADLVIAQINPNMPRTHGDGVLHISQLDYIVPVTDALPEHAPETPSPEDILIGQHCASLVENGATLQMGIGTIPDACLACLGDRKDLGVHTEMFSNGILDLYKKGVVTNAKKTIDAGVIVTSFSFGDRELYDFLDDNIEVRFRTTNYANNIRNIALNPKVVAINSAIEVDLSGQVCADSMGTSVYSGSGGQLDFARGAHSSEGGRFVIALRSTTKKGKSKIVPTLAPGAGVVTPRTLTQYVITEYGIAYLFGKNLQQRAAELIKIAHPDHRAALEKEYAEVLKWEPNTMKRWRSFTERTSRFHNFPLHNE